MFQFFWNRFRTSDRPQRAVWCDDVLRHPAIEVMDERQRGDLPLPRPAAVDCGSLYMNGVCRGGSGSTSM